MALDALVLVLLGAVFMALPVKVGNAFGFAEFPGTACYLVAMWGCALLSLGVGYAMGAGDPVRNVAWVQAGIVRGVFECGLGFIMASRHMVTWHHSALGTGVAGVIAAGYLVLYPYPGKVAKEEAP